MKPNESNETNALRVLIAEDDPVSRLMLKGVLTKWGYEVIATRDGDEAWAAFQAEDAPRLAILDWMMPGMDGVDVCYRVRQIDTPYPFYLILLTALGREEDIVAGFDAGADDYMTKPFSNSELRVRIEAGRRVIELQAALAKRIEELQDALAQVKTLQGILPICMYCHKIRTDQESWERIESYISRHSDALFSHGLCPECLEKYYPEPEEDEGAQGGDDGASC